MNTIEENVDVVVVGAGHDGCEVPDLDWRQLCLR